MPPERRCLRQAARNLPRIEGSSLIRVLASAAASNVRSRYSSSILQQMVGRIRDMGQHRQGIVNSEHLMAQPGQRAQDAAGAAAQLQDRRALRDGGMHDLRLAERRRPPLPAPADRS